MNKKYLKDVFFTLSNQILRIISGPIMLLMIPIYLTNEEQGLWYTFSSLSALSIFADLGFSNIILQFSSHEFAKLKLNDKFLLEGDPYDIDKLSSLFKFIVKWVIIASSIAFPLIYFVGLNVLSKKLSYQIWIIPWSFYTLTSYVLFIINNILCFFEGFDIVSKIQKIRLKSSFISTTTLMLSLYLDLKLFSIVLSNIVAIIILIVSINMNFKFVFNQMIKTSFKFDWFKEISNLLWKYAISFGSGYFIFQTFTPLMYMYKGPIEAGKIGISISLVTSVFSISNSFMSAVTPKINVQISKKNWSGLDSIFDKSLRISMYMYLTGAIIIFLMFYIFDGTLIINSKNILDRFISPISMLILTLSWFFQLYVNAIALYVRSHKEDPFVFLSLAFAIYIPFSTFLSSKYLSSDYFFLGFFSAIVISIPYIYYHFKIKKKGHYENK